MGKFKESYSNVYYNSQDDFFSDLETGENQPTYVGLLEIVRVLKLIRGGQPQKKSDISKAIPTGGKSAEELNDAQLCLPMVSA